MLFDDHHPFELGELLSTEALRKLSFSVKSAESPLTFSLSQSAYDRIERCHSYLLNKIKSSADPIYGINTGFGSLCDIEIAESDLSELQSNLVKSHACGSGKQLDNQLVRLMLAFKIQGLAGGHSGVSLATVERLLLHLNEDALPIVYEQGSLGASGDLAPLAHLSLPLIGEGEVIAKGIRMYSSDWLKANGLSPLVLGPKEGLALLNGTQFMSALGQYAVCHAENLLNWSSIIAGLSAEAFLARREPFFPQLHQIRRHQGQTEIARLHLDLVKDSPIGLLSRPAVQDPYSFRCIPQVHGASLAAFNFVADALDNEVNAVTDNPNIFPEDDLILSGGNFHGQPIAMPMDFLALALHELGNISERRGYLLISGQRGLPPFLAGNPGLESGLMIPQYTAASLVSRTKLLATPASADSIVSSNGQEDHVSMGAHSATKLLEVVDTVYRVLAIEMLTAIQALSFRTERLSPILEQIRADFSPLCGDTQKERVLATPMREIAEQLSNQLAASYLEAFKVKPLVS